LKEEYSDKKAKSGGRGDEGKGGRVNEGYRGDIKMEEVRNIQAGKTERGKLLVVRLKSEDMKRRVLMSKRKLRGGEIWIEEDLTWEKSVAGAATGLGLVGRRIILPKFGLL